MARGLVVALLGLPLLPSLALRLLPIRPIRVCSPLHAEFVPLSSEIEVLSSPRSLLF